MYFLLSLLLGVLSHTAIAAEQVNYREIEGWLTPPPGQATIGDAHGGIAVSRNGNIYVSIMGSPKGIQIYAKNGKYLGNVDGAPNSFHDFTIHQDKDGQEYIYGAELGGKRILKMTLDGKVLLAIDAFSSVPAKYQKDRKSGLYLTGTAVSADDHIYVVDGYGRDFIHHFDESGQYVNSFGGREAPYGFKTCHKILFDTRFQPERLTCADRGNQRLVQMDHSGNIIVVYEGDYRLPSDFTIYGNHMAIAGLGGKVTILDLEGNIMTTVSQNKNQDEIGTNNVTPDLWENGKVTAPHGITYDAYGNILVSEWNKWGRVHFFKRK